MRRILLVFTFMSFAAWSQPAQQQAQPPIVINNVPPHEGFWTGLLKLAIPTIVAAALASGITLYGVNRTHKHQAAENEANRTHLLQVEIAKAEIAAKHRSQDRRWEFRKDVYVNLIQSTSLYLEFFQTLGSTIAEISRLKQQSPVDLLQVITVTKEAQALLARITPINTQFDLYSYLAPLATADDVLPLIAEVKRTKPSYEIGDLAVPDDFVKWTHTNTEMVTELLKKLQETGRKDLWGTPEAEAKAERV